METLPGITETTKLGFSIQNIPAIAAIAGIRATARILIKWFRSRVFRQYCFITVGDLTYDFVGTFLREFRQLQRSRQLPEQLEPKLGIRCFRNAWQCFRCFFIKFHCFRNAWQRFRVCESRKPCQAL